MKHANLLQIGIVLVGIVSLSQQAMACGYSTDPDRFRMSFFHPDIVADTNYRMCYLDAKYYATQNYYYQPLVEREHSNLTEWKAYTKDKATLGDIATIVYKTTMDSLATYVRGAIVSGENLPAELIGNSFVNFIVKEKDIDLLDYLLFAKSCEPYNEFDIWDGKQVDGQALALILEKGKNLYKKTASNFLQLRYGFQLTRLAHYNFLYEDGRKMYDEYVQPIIIKKNLDELTENSVIQDWAMALKGGIHKRLQEDGKALYYFSKVFAQNKDKRKLMLHNFSVRSEKDFQAALKLATTDEEKANLWLLKGLEVEGLSLQPLQNMLAAQPSSDKLDILLIREVNKIEQELVSPILTDPVTLQNSTKASIEAQFRNNTYASIGDYIKRFFKTIWRAISSLWTSDKGNIGTTEITGNEALREIGATIKVGDLVQSDYVDSLQALIKEGISTNKINTPNLWYVTGAYLAFLSKNYEQANTLLQEVKNPTGKVANQTLLIKNLVDLFQQQQLTDSLANNFYIAIKDLKINPNSYNNYAIANRVLTILGQQYLVQGNVPMAVLCWEKAAEETGANVLVDFVATQQDLNGFIGLLATPTTQLGELTNFLLKDSRYNKATLLDVKATKLMRKHQFEEALALYKQIPDNYWIVNEEEEDSHWYWEAYLEFKTSFETSAWYRGLDEESHQTYNKKTFAQKVVYLLKAAKKQPNKAAIYYYQIANGFYHTPFWGYNGKVWQGGLVGAFRYYGEYEPENYPFNLTKLADFIAQKEATFLQEYGLRNMSEHYYNKVIETTKDKELGAKAAYLAKLSQLEPTASFQEPNAKDPTYIKVLTNKYKDTEFFKQLIEECEGIATYL